jgi:drug/metabolite transporter (DMT)-like permease
MNWLYIVIFAHLVFAVTAIIDKFLVSKTSLKPAAYAFYVGLLSIFVLVLIPFDFSFIPLEHIIISFVAGALFTFSLLFLYQAFEKNDVSKIAPIYGAAAPIFTLILAFIFLGERLAGSQIIAFSVLVAGGIMLASSFSPRTTTKHNVHSVAARGLAGASKAVFAGLLLGASFVFSKFIYNNYSFINSFIWLRSGSFLGALLMLLSPDNRRAIWRANKKTKAKTGGLVIFNKLLGAGGFIALNFGIYLGSVTLANTLQGIQYLFLLILTIVLSKKLPEIIKEKISLSNIIPKLIGIMLIGLGLVILAF